MTADNRSSKILAWALSASVFQAVIVLVSVSRSIFFGRVGRWKMFDDVDLYYRYATKAIEGQIPWRDYVVEYPPASFPLFFLPRVFAGDVEGFRWLFGFEMLAINAIGVILLARRVERDEGSEKVPVRLGWYTLSFAVLCPLLITRFDLAPMVLAFAAASFWSSGRAKLGGALAAIGGLSKIFPVAIVAPGLAWDFLKAKKRGAGLPTFLVVTVIGVGGWTALAGPRLKKSLDYHLGRDLEIGSIYGAVAIVEAKLVGDELRGEYRHKSAELIAPWSKPLARLALPVQFLATAVVAVRAWKTKGREPLRDSAAAVIGFAAFGKVLSPQYILWPLPLIVALPGRTGRLARPLYLACCGLTTLLYPWAFEALARFDGRAVMLLCVRNAALLALWVRLAFGGEEEAKSRRLDVPSLPRTAGEVRGSA